MEVTQTLPMVSVLLPAFNAAAYLGETMAAALGQSFTDFELLVLDNASTDDTAAVVAGFSDQRIRYHRNATNVGFAGNVEVGRRLAQARYVVVLNADDIWERDYLAATVARLEADPRLGFVHTRITLIDSDGRPFGEAVKQWRDHTPGREAFVNCFLFGFSFPTMMMRNEVLRSVPALPTGEHWGRVADCWLFLQLCQRGDVGYIAAPLMQYRVHDRSLMFEIYADGSYLRLRLATVRDAFGWPAARDPAIAAERGRVVRQVAREAIASLPIIRRTNTRTRLLRSFFAILRQVPAMALFPGVWLRLGFGLLPRRAIESLRMLKRNAWAARNLRALRS